MKEQIKKVVFVALVAAVSIAAQADALSWKIDKVGTSGGNTLSETSNYKAYLFEATGNTEEARQKKLDTITSQILRKEKSSDGTYAFLSSKKDTLSSTYDSSDGTATFSSSTTLSLTSGTSYFFAIILDSTSLDTATRYMVAKEYTNRSYKTNPQEIISVTATSGSSSTRTAQWGDQTDSGLGSVWVTIPEPTSGLLLVLGAATLALKRRRV